MRSLQVFAIVTPMLALPSCALLYDFGEAGGAGATGTTDVTGSGADLGAVPGRLRV